MDLTFRWLAKDWSGGYADAYEAGRVFFLPDAPRSRFRSSRRADSQYIEEGLLLDEIRYAYDQQARLLDTLRGADGLLPKVTSGYRVNSENHRRGALDFSTKEMSPDERRAQAATWSSKLGRDDLVLVEELYWVEQGAIVPNASRETLVRSRTIDEMPALPTDPPQVVDTAPKNATVVQINTSYRQGRLLRRSIGPAKATATHTHVQPGPKTIDPPLDLLPRRAND